MLGERATEGSDGMRRLHTLILGKWDRLAARMIYGCQSKLCLF